MQKIVCIVGPTATGKTKKALSLASAVPSILVSADSRQVYRQMDIVTGKDHPKDQQIFGIDILDPDEASSVSLWYNTVVPHLQAAWANNQQVIIVGGTGLYVKAITGGIDTMAVPINKSLRAELETFSTDQLQTMLTTLNPTKISSMNNSDLHNPRRLIRAIEISKSGISPSIDNKNFQLEMIGLKYLSPTNHRIAIESRVMERLQLGAIEETKQLLSKYDPRSQSLSAIGYKSIISHLRGDLTYQEMVEQWVDGEISYAKRQLTWFNKQPVIWYDVDSNSTVI